ncbi:MAG: flagellar basal-body MS-ring/collar protein FliF, partial [Burkholderiales bacterium]
QRGLEGELTRSIQALASVQSARVHLALPNQNGFFREQQKPSASVLLTLHGGRTLERSQIAGIVHLVASSVPELNPRAVSVLDDSGKLLSDSGDTTVSVDSQQLQYQQQLEQGYTRRILDILEPVVGRNNVKAQVSAELDFSQTEATLEEHRPNLAATASAVRSQQTVETTGPSAGAVGGVPGATSNQPPGPSSAPINGKAAPLAPTASPEASRGPGKRESTINYEVDKTVKTVRSATGQVRRLSAAVVVNYRNVADAQGKASANPLTAEQIEQMTALVRETIGFRKDRGDTVNLMNTPFLVEANIQPELPIWKDPETLNLIRSFAWPIGLVLVGAIVLLGLVRPSLKVLASNKPSPLVRAKISAIESEALERPALSSPGAGALPAPSSSSTPGSAQAQAEAEPEGAAEQARLEGARQMARQNPVAVANIVKSWIHADA